MSDSATYQDSILAPALSILESALSGIGQRDREDLQLSTLEVCASIIGGYDLHGFTDITGHGRPSTESRSLARRLISIINSLPIEPALVLSILSAIDIGDHERKTKGAYNTDFRLAKHLAARMPNVKGRQPLKIIDPASGPGILLVAYVIRQTQHFHVPIEFMLSESIYAADMSDHAIRGVLLSLSSMSSDLTSISKLQKHLICTDSLLAPMTLWRSFAPDGFDGVIANPPWERLRLLKHEHVKANGNVRHYGADYPDESDPANLETNRQALQLYRTKLSHSTTFKWKGEQDLYKLFLELAQAIARPDGKIAFLIPAGLIRSHGLTDLRTKLVKTTAKLDITIADNKARFFSIDTRFKYLVLEADLSSISTQHKTLLRHATGTVEGLTTTRGVNIQMQCLRKFRPDLTIPEVRTSAEWLLFKRISQLHPAFGDPRTIWRHQCHRELDMSLDRKLFIRNRRTELLPLIEGRMVHQFQFGAKAYASGTGRRAVWNTSTAANVNDLHPQYYIAPQSLDVETRRLSMQLRVGFCDITGQTNERTMLASIIPAGCVAGNKVPTVEFYHTSDWPQLALIWLGVVNSLTFDWLLRRVCTTTINYFILDSVPIPVFTQNSAAASRIARLANMLMHSTADPFTTGTAQARANLEQVVAEAYGISASDYRLILNDFSQLDKHQPSILSEHQSTITKDTALHAVLCGQDLLKEAKSIELRIRAARNIGAIPFVPNQFYSSVCKK